MGRSRTIRFTVKMVTYDRGFGMTESEYRGKRSEKGLREYIDSFNASLLPGGINARLGIESRVVSATVYDHGCEIVRVKIGERAPQVAPPPMPWFTVEECADMIAPPDLNDGRLLEVF